MKRRHRRGVSLGTIVMLTLTALVLAAFAMLLPKLTSSADLTLNASQLAVALDRSIVQFSDAASAPAASPQPDTAAAFRPAAQATASPTAAPQKMSFSLCAGGSLKFNSAVLKAVTQDGAPHFDWVLEPIAGELSADLTLATLENGFATADKPNDLNMPLELAAALKQNGFDALSLGYYNALNNGVAGLKAAKEALSAAGITAYGAYASLQERNALTLTEANGVSVALLSYQSDLSSAGKKKASTEEQGYALLNLQLPVIAADIKAVKGMGAQVVAVSLCWGKTGATEPTATQAELAQGIADAGADIILGTHSEAVQRVAILTANRGDDRYHPVLCAYNLGNLFTHNREKRISLAGVLLHATVEYDPATDVVAFDDLTYTPTYCWRGKENDIQRYRVLNSGAGQWPDYVAADQRDIMERCLNTIQEAMAGSGFAKR